MDLIQIAFLHFKPGKTSWSKITILYINFTFWYKCYLSWDQMRMLLCNCQDLLLFWGLNLYHVAEKLFDSSPSSCSSNWEPKCSYLENFFFSNWNVTNHVVVIFIDLLDYWGNNCKTCNILLYCWRIINHTRCFILHCFILTLIILKLTSTNLTPTLTYISYISYMEFIGNTAGQIVFLKFLENQFIEWNQTTFDNKLHLYNL